MNVVLIGYRGTGKSTVGKLVGKVLNMSYICLDEEIVSRAGKSIPEIVAEDSWIRFRDLEESVVKAVSSSDHQVIDTGGGVIGRPQNCRRLRKNGVVFLLEATVSDIVKRIKGDTERPSLTGAKSFTDEVREVLRERNPVYRATADYTIDTSTCTPEQTAQMIVEKFNFHLREASSSSPD